MRLRITMIESEMSEKCNKATSSNNRRSLASRQGRPRGSLNSERHHLIDTYKDRLHNFSHIKARYVLTNDNIHIISSGTRLAGRLAIRKLQEGSMVSACLMQSSQVVGSICTCRQIKLSYNLNVSTKQQQ